ncbi:hypothetical protein AB6D11_06275 [Vibrio splendidus]
MELSIVNKHDIKVLRILLGLSCKKMGSIVGLSHTTISELEKGNIELCDFNIQLYKAAIYLHHCGRQVASLYGSINSLDYLEFLDTKITSKSDRALRVGESSCSCGSVKGTYTLKRFGTYLNEYLHIACSDCPEIYPVLSMSDIRLLILKFGDFNPYDFRIFDSNYWRTYGYEHFPEMAYLEGKKTVSIAPAKEILSDMLDTPNKLIGLRIVMSLSSSQMGQRLNRHPSFFRKMELSTNKIAIASRLAILGLFIEECQRRPWLKKIYKELDCDSLVEELVQRHGNKIPITRRPVCEECGSQDIKVGFHGSLRKRYWIRCRQCKKARYQIEGDTVRRMYHMDTNKSIDLFNSDWYANTTRKLDE